MGILFGTDDGVWKIDNGTEERIGLAGKSVCHVADRGTSVLAAVPRDGLYEISGPDDRLIWEGDARACAVGPDDRLYVGMEPAMVFRSEDRGQTWSRSDGIDQLPTRDEWYFPSPPHEPHVRSMDFLPNAPGSLLVGVEVGGVLLSQDYGDSWRELNNGVNVDVHAVKPDPSQPERMIAVTGQGLYISEDLGGSWERVTEGLDLRYAVGLHFNPYRPGEVLLSAGDGPPGMHGRVLHSLNGGRSWTLLTSQTLPETYGRVPVVLFAKGSWWIATENGQVFRADDPGGDWSLICELPTAIHAASAGGSPSSVSSGYV